MVNYIKNYKHMPLSNIRKNIIKANDAFDLRSGGMSKARVNMSEANMSVAPSTTPNTPVPTPSTPTPTSPAPSAPTPTSPSTEAVRGFNAATAKEFKNLYGRNPLSGELHAFIDGTFNPNPTPAFPSANAGSSAVQDPGAEKAAREAEIANARARTDQIVNNTPAGFTDGTFGESDLGQTLLSEIRKIASGPGNIDEAAIRSAGDAAAAQFDPLILKAKRAAEQGRGQNLARAAATGQLDSTAVAGIAALTGNENVGLEDGKAFEGSGGILSRLGAEYDLNISQLEAAQIAARRAAEQAERQFQATGRQEDFNRALQLYEVASTAFNEKNTLAEQKQVAMQRAAQIALTQQQADFSSEDRIMSQIAPDLLQYDEAGNPILPDDATIAEAALQYGVSPEALKAGLRDEVARIESGSAAAVQAELDQMEQIVDILSDVPDGQEVTVGGSVYTGFKEGNNKTYKEVDSAGNVTFITLDGSGNIINTTSGGRVSKGSSRSGNTSSAGFSLSEPDSFEEWLNNEQEVAGQTFNTDDAQVKQDLELRYRDYVANFTPSQILDSGDFTNTQILKLEQAGLLGASRQEQLNFLYGGGSSGGEGSSIEQLQALLGV